MQSARIPDAGMLDGILALVPGGDDDLYQPALRLTLRGGFPRLGISDSMPPDAAMRIRGHVMGAKVEITRTDHTAKTSVSSVRLTSTCRLENGLQEFCNRRQQPKYEIERVRFNHSEEWRAP